MPRHPYKVQKPCRGTRFALGYWRRFGLPLCLFHPANPLFSHYFIALYCKDTPLAAETVQTIGTGGPLPDNTMLTFKSQTSAPAAKPRHYGTFKGQETSLADLIVLSTEDPARFEKLLASLIEEFQPDTFTEHHFVESMAIARWRLIRNGTMQIELLKMPASPSLNALQFLQREKTALKRRYSSARRDFLEFRSSKTCAA